MGRAIRVPDHSVTRVRIGRDCYGEECEHPYLPDEPSYLAWHEWAEKKAKTHVQERCPNCGLWVFWRAA